MYRTCLPLVHAAVAAAALTVTIDPTPRQTLTSFGASGAWWPNDLIHFPTHVQQQLGKLLFSEDGLYLSSYRYNMGADGGNDTQQVTVNGSRVESFLLRNGTYDWARDHAGVTFMEMAQQYRVPYITFFINAAPSHIATNGAACGWDFTNGSQPAYAQYVETVLSHWVDHGIDIKYISPMNEPDYNHATCTQEGMAVAPDFRASVFQTIKTALSNSSAHAVDIIGDETSQVTTEAIPEDPDWLPAAAPVLSNIAIHNYDYPDDASLAVYYSSIQNLTTGEDLPPVKLTETCCSTNAGSGSSVFGAQYDPTMTNALIVARYVWQFLTIVQAESFDWWTAVADLPCSPKINGIQCATSTNETSGYNSGLIYIDGDYNQTLDYTLYLTKRAWMLKHFAYFHRPGSVRYDIGQGQLPLSVNAIATTSGPSNWWAARPRGDGNSILSVLFMNNATQAQNLTLQVPGDTPRLKTIVQTTPSEDWEVLKHLPVVRNNSLPITLPAQSLVSLQFSH